MINRRSVAQVFYWLYMIATGVYLVWRMFFTIPWADGAFSIAFGCVLLLSEISSSLGTFEIYIRRMQNRRVDLTLPQIPESWYPEVDVFIATHNEEPELLYKTVNACKNFDYPDKRKVHIYFCDDGNRPEVARLALHFGVGYLGLANNTEAKSGNYNNAIRHTSSPLIATFDADMIGRHSFLMETVPYFYLPYVERDAQGRWTPRPPERVDPAYKIGLVQTPQSFYNPDLFQFNLFAERSIPNEQDYFSREINILRNSDNAIAYTGSNTVIARQALADIGNFPTDTITEDFETGLKIQAAGYTCFATEKVLASGLTVTTVKSMITQRVRWARGVIQTVRNCKIPVNKNLTFSAKTSYMASFTYWWSFAQRLVFTSAPILFALFGIRIVSCGFEQLVMFWLPSYLCYLAAEKLSAGTIRNQRWNQIIDTILAPFLVIPVFLETIGIKQKKFKVTDKRRKQKAGKFLFILPHLVILGLTVAALARFMLGKSGMALLYGVFIIFWLGYNGINLVFAVLFMLGRPAQRYSERFEASVALYVILSEGQILKTVTGNLSEGGLMFTLPKPVMVPWQQPIRMRLDTERYHVKLVARVLYVDSAPGLWKYHCAIVSMNEPNWREYLQLVYDRPHPLPTRMNQWMTPFDSILNIHRERGRKHRTERRTSPRVGINREAAFREGGGCFVVDFNYRYLLVRDLALPREIPPHLTLMVEEAFPIRCVPVESGRARRGERLLRVLNHQELAQDPAFVNALMRWSAAPQGPARDAGPAREREMGWKQPREEGSNA